MTFEISKIDSPFEALCFEDLPQTLQKYLQQYSIEINPSTGGEQNRTALYYKVDGKYRWIKNIALKSSREFERGIDHPIESPGSTLFGDSLLQGGIVGFILLREDDEKLFPAIYDERKERQWIKPLPTGLVEWYEGAEPFLAFYRELYEEILLGKTSERDTCYHPPLLSGIKAPYTPEELQKVYRKFGFDIRAFRTTGKLYPYGIRYVNRNNRALETVFFWDTDLEMTEDIYGISLEGHPKIDGVSEPLLYGKFSERAQGMIRFIGLGRKGSLHLSYPADFQPTDRGPRSHPSIREAARGKWLEKAEFGPS